MAGSIVTRLLACRRGNIALTFAIAAAPLMTAVGAGVDYSRAEQQRTQIQGTLDAALLAGAKRVGTEIATATTFFAKQSTVAGATTSFQLSGTQLSGTATATIKTTFLAIAGHSTITVTARGGGDPHHDDDVQRCPALHLRPGDQHVPGAADQFRRQDQRTGLRGPCPLDRVARRDLQCRHHPEPEDLLHSGHEHHQEHLEQPADPDRLRGGERSLCRQAAEARRGHLHQQQVCL